MTWREWLLEATPFLNNTDAPRLGAELILTYITGASRLDLIMAPNTALTENQLAVAWQQAARFAAGEPLAYLLKRKEFYGREFSLNRATLIPRPDTECMLEYALNSLPKIDINFADFGVGCGCIAVSLALERPAWQGLGLDNNPEALAAASYNSTLLGAENLSFAQADFTRPETLTTLPLCAFSLDLLIANPPYISQAEYDNLADNVRLYEPKAALVSGASGLTHIMAIVAAAPDLLKPGGLLLIEHGATQGDAVKNLCLPTIWKNVETGRDLAEQDRYLIAWRR